MLDPAFGGAPHWLIEHRDTRPYRGSREEDSMGNIPVANRDRGIIFSRQNVDEQLLLMDKGFNNHATNDGSHVSPYDEGRVSYGLDDLQVRLIQGVDESGFKRFLSRSLRATTGISPLAPVVEDDSDEMMRGGLQSALESQTIVFEVIGASRALTHQLVRSRRAAFHQQSQRATWYGDRPNVRRPMSILRTDETYPSGGPDVVHLWDKATVACWEAYKAACDAGISYQDARYILPEGTTNYILCEYTVREFINVFAYRGCSMFLWEMVGCMRRMRTVLLAAHPFLEPYVKISCEKTGFKCPSCKGSGYRWSDGVAADPSEVEEFKRSARTNPLPMGLCDDCDGVGFAGRKCTFQGWENVEKACDFPWAKQYNRVFLPKPALRIGG